jgi:hypothetical protein
MTLEQVMALSVEELRIKAAELAGWKGGERLCADEPSSIIPCLEGEQDVSDCTHLDGGGCWEDCKQKFSPPPPDYPHDIAAAWELFEEARNGERFWDFAQAMEALCDDPDMATRDAPLPVIHVLGHLTPGLVTRAFVLAMSS